MVFFLWVPHFTSACEAMNVIYFNNAVVCFGVISVSTQIWIYLTYSTLAGNRPRWCIFRTFPAAHMMCVDTTRYCLTLLEPPH